MSQLISPLKFLRIRNIFLNKFQSTHYFTIRGRYFSTKGDGDQDPKDASNGVSSSAKKDLNPKSEETLNEDSDKKSHAKKKLFSLLSEFKVENAKGEKVGANLNLTKAVKRPLKKERFKDLKKLTPQEKLQEAVKNVAENVSGDPNQTQMDLNKRLSSLNLVDSETGEMEAVSEDVTEVDEEMKTNIMSSVEDVASTVTGVKDIDSIKSKLTQRLMRLSVEDKSAMSNKSIDLLKGMKVEHMKRPTEDQQDLQINRKAQQPQRLAPKPRLSTVNIFQSPPLDIFTIEESKVEEKNTIWNRLEEKNLKLLVQFAPSNGFEEMIMWTEQGKHWKFPIDNEAAMGEEENVGFHEHVFLERHLHGFPTKGPVRQFMELVCVGLSKNPYITVERKIENIDWFRNYFKEKEEILKRYDILG